MLQHLASPALPATHRGLPAAWPHLSPFPLCPCRSEAALLSLGADVAVFVGDFGEEAVQVRRCAGALLNARELHAVRSRRPPTCAALCACALQLVEQIAAVPCPKAVILGNHDAWWVGLGWVLAR